MITRRGLLCGATALLGASGLAACGGPEPDDDAITVGLTYIPNVQFCAFYLGLKEALFTKHGLTVTLRHHGEQEDTFGALLSGQEDVVFAAADEAMVAAAEGKDLRTFATSYQVYPVEIMGGDPSTPQPGLGLLKGKRLGMPGHYGSSYYAALCALHEAGLSEDDVTLQPVGYTQVSALTSGKVDFIVGFRNNEGVQLAAAGKRVLSLPISPRKTAKLVGPSLITHGTRLSKTSLASFAAALKEAEEAVIADPSAAIEATAGEVPALADAKQRASARKVLEATTGLWKGEDGKVDVSVPKETFARMGEFLRSVGVIKTIPANPYLDPAQK